MSGIRSWLNRASAVNPVAAVSSYPSSWVWTMKVTSPITVGDDFTTTMKHLIERSRKTAGAEVVKCCSGFFMLAVMVVVAVVVVVVVVVVRDSGGCAVGVADLNPTKLDAAIPPVLARRHPEPLAVQNELSYTQRTNSHGGQQGAGRHTCGFG